jgi:hypothetical protein
MKNIRLPFGIVSLALCFFAAPLFANAMDVRPEDFGAVVNDGLDDSAAIQAAANAIFKHGGGTILFPSGKLEIRNTIRFVPENYIGADVKLKGTRGSVIEISTGTYGIAFYGGNLNTWIFEDLVIIGKDVPPGNPAFYDAWYVVFSNYVQQTNITRCQFYGLAVPNASSIVYFGNTDGKVVDSQFDGSLAEYPDGSVIMAENSRGLTVSRTTFLDYANFMGSYLSKTPSFVGSWIRVKGGQPLNANGQRRFVVEDSRFDEGAAVAVRIEDVTWASLSGISVNVNATDVGTGISLKNVEFAAVGQSWFGYTNQVRPALSTENVETLEVNSLKFGGGVYFRKGTGAGAIDIRNCPQCRGQARKN